ncbi:hypothetical protein WJX84_009464 [Apatococcus fuscideae]|uniref:RecF/RecN/SMC N-terminal domain-containing protein n=1 Tax=Apatococcus fuscideae TaxID=2026836 RepID=A0AAW1T2Q4_9CHLO
MRQLQHARNLEQSKLDEVFHLEQQLSLTKGSAQVHEQQMMAYQHLHTHHGEAVGDPSGGQAVTPVCDRCLQPIDSMIYNQNLERLQAECTAAHHAKQQEEARVTEARRLMGGLRGQREAEATHLEQLQAEQLQMRAQAQQLVDQKHDARRYAQLQQSRVQEERQHLRWRVECVTAEAREVIEAEAADAVASADPRSDLEIPQEVSRAANLLSELIREARPALAHHQRLQSNLTSHQAQKNEHKGEAGRMQAMQRQEEALRASAAEAQQAAATEAAWLAELDAAFSRTGIQSFAIEGVLGELQVVTSRYLEQLSTGMVLKLSATRPSSGQSSAVERISKAVQVRTAKGETRERTVRQLSGGERRRVGLALALGFSELIAARSRLRTNLIVLDEVLQHLDEEGNARVCSLLRGMHQDTVLIVGQADSYVAQAFDAVDVVVKQNGQSHLLLA